MKYHINIYSFKPGIVSPTGASVRSFTMESSGGSMAGSSRRVGPLTPRFIISGGGTGGHIFPAIAIANAIKKEYPAAEILFVGAKGRMEMEKVPAAGFKIEGLWISGMQRGAFTKNILLPIKVISSVIQANRIIARFKPDVVIGVGGYASGPLLYAATIRGIPTLIQEQNCYAGATNRILGKRVQKICVAFDGMEKFFPSNKIIRTGNPVRQDIINIKQKREEGLNYFGLKGDRKVVLITGGSLGAGTINRAIRDGFSKILNEPVDVIWQTGKLYYQELKKLAEDNGVDHIKVFEFIQRMDLAYSVADITVARAGAISVSELSVAGKASILVPLPSAAENHQYINAMELVKKEAAILVNDSEASEKLVDTALSLIHDESRIKSLEENISGIALHNAAQNIANEILSLIKIKKD